MGHLSSFHVSLLRSVVVYKLSKKVHFLQFCADLTKKCNSVEAIYIYTFESSHYTLAENAMGSEPTLMRY